MDFTLMPDAIAEMMDKAGCKLSLDQKLILSGALASYQQSIADNGLEQVVKNLANSTV